MIDPARALLEAELTADEVERILRVCGPRALLYLAGIHWVIIGGESGPGARPMSFDRLAGVVEQCRAQSVALFLKRLRIPQNNPL